MAIILASASPRRRELLTMLGIHYIIRPAGCEESRDASLPPEKQVMSLSRQKAEDAASRSEAEDLVIAADTLVFLDGRALGKPRDEAEAAEMLRALSGRTHEVFTGVTLIKNKIIISDYERTEVRFRELDEAEIEKYVESGEPLDKAGAYGAQGRAAVFVEGINGDFFNVMGLPLCRLDGMMKKMTQGTAHSAQGSGNEFFNSLN